MGRRSPATTTGQPAAPGPLPALLLGAALVVATLLVYCPVLDFQFINFDDQGYVAVNRHVLDGLTAANAAWAWTTFHAANSSATAAARGSATAVVWAGVARRNQLRRPFSRSHELRARGARHHAAPAYRLRP